MVPDLNNQAQESSTSFLVHPSDLYVGVRVKETFSEPNKPVHIELIVRLPFLHFILCVFMITSYTTGGYFHVLRLAKVTNIDGKVVPGVQVNFSGEVSHRVKKVSFSLTLSLPLCSCIHRRTREAIRLWRRRWIRSRRPLSNLAPNP